MEIQFFEYGLNQMVREVTMSDEAWFVAKDICDILDITDTSQAIERLDEDEKLMRKLYVSGQSRELWVINESGLYHLVLTSSKPEAKKFRKWITSEVIPEIRKAGKYTSKQERRKNDRIKELREEIRILKVNFSQARRTISDKEQELDTLIGLEPNQLELFFSNQN